MATLAVQKIVRTGLELVPVAATGGGDAFPNDGKTFIYVNNASGGDITVTIVSQQTIDGLAVADKAVIVTASDARYIGPWPIPLYNDANGLVQLTYSGVTSLTVAALRLGDA